MLRLGRLPLIALLCGLTACNVMSRREHNTDPKPDLSSERSAAEKEREPSLSLWATSLSAESDSVQVGSTIGVTLSVKNTRGELMTSMTGATVAMVLAGGGSLGTVTDIIDNEDGTYSGTLTGVASGAASKLSAVINGSPVLNTLDITVNPGDPVKVVIETAEDGSGAAVDDLTITDGEPLTLYAIARDVGDNYVGGVTVDWSESGSLGSFSASTGLSTIYTPHLGAGTTVITADHESLLDDTTGTITVEWTVTNLANLLVWLKADALSLSDNDPVASWADVSGNAHDAAQGTGSLQPTYKATDGPNSLPTVSFDGAGDLLKIAHAGGLNTNHVSVFAVFKNNTSKNFATLMMKTSSSSWNDGWGFGEMSGSGTGFGLFINDISSNKATGNVSTGSYQVLSGVYDGSNIKFYQDGSESGSQAYSTSISGSAEDIYIGDFVGNSGCAVGCLSGEVAEMILYGEGLTNIQRQSVESYLSTKYGL